jgi:hypothetical protein
MDSFKAYATRALRRAGLIGPDVKVWSGHGSTKYLWTDEHVQKAVEYVVNGQAVSFRPLTEVRRVEGALTNVRATDTGWLLTRAGYRHGRAIDTGGLLTRAGCWHFYSKKPLTVNDGLM